MHKRPRARFHHRQDPKLRPASRRQSPNSQKFSREQPWTARGSLILIKAMIHGRKLGLQTAKVATAEAIQAEVIRVGDTREEAATPVVVILAECLMMATGSPGTMKRYRN